MTFQAPLGLDPTAPQRDFRWASPLEVVTGLMPALLDAGIDPFDKDLPLTGSTSQKQLTDGSPWYIYDQRTQGQWLAPGTEFPYPEP